MCQIIRQVHSDTGNILSEESFVEFIETKQKTRSTLADEIMNKLKQDRTNIKNAWGQGYSNGANMSAVHKGAKALIIKQNEFANVYYFTTIVDF